VASKSKKEFYMKNGLVIGKFCPLHNGHLLLINFAKKHCENLKVAVCSTEGEKFSGEIRKNWILEATNKTVTVDILNYDSKILPNTSVSSKEVSKLWAQKFKELFPETEVIFTSEQYGDYVAGFMNIKHIKFDEARKVAPVSASAILSSPFLYWDYIPEVVRPSFVKKICIAGTESTGKSTLTQRLANYFHTNYVAEAGRDIVPVSNECRQEDLLTIAEVHAKEIIKQTLSADKILFLDTDLRITKSYSQFLFNSNLVVDDWIETANKCDLYIFLESDCEFVQDGTRLSYCNKGLPLVFIDGSWDNRFEKAVSVIGETFFTKKAAII
jgi:HTH-type transcriptional regulator, transcriptional repressor of NAD biosynthesis genes